MNKSLTKSLFVAVLALFITFGTADYCFSQNGDTRDLELIVKEANKQLPQDYGIGMVCTKMVIQNGYLAYYYTCDEQYYDIDQMNKNIPTYKTTIIAMLNADNFEMNELRKACKKAKVGIAYYYTGKQSKKVASVKIPYSDLK